jgi:hypothetical protein
MHKTFAAALMFALAFPSFSQGLAAPGLERQTAASALDTPEQ